MNKTLDGRFIEKRVKISKKTQVKLIRACKNHNDYSWREFSKELEISEHTLKNQ